VLLNGRIWGSTFDDWFWELEGMETLSEEGDVTVDIKNTDNYVTEESTRQGAEDFASDHNFGIDWSEENKRSRTRNI